MKLASKGDNFQEPIDLMKVEFGENSTNLLTSINNVLLKYETTWRLKYDRE